MIVLRITVDGRSWNVEATAPRVLLGSAAEADVREDGVGWQPAEAVLHHRGTEVLLERPGGGKQLRLRVGDEVRLGRARIALVGMLPLPADLEGTDAEAPPPFGMYDEGPRPPGGQFDLAPAHGTGTLSSPAGSAQTSRPPSEPPSAPSARATPTAQPPASTTPQPETGSTSPGTSLRGVLPPPRPPAPAFRRPEFGSELVTQIRRAPFFVLSVALHALVFIILTMVQTSADQGAEDRRNGSLFASLQSPMAEQTQPEDDEAAGEDLDTPELPQMPEPSIPDPMAMNPAGQPDNDETMRLDPLPPSSVEVNPLLGLNPSAAKARVRRGKALLPIPDVDLKETFAKGASTGANQQAAEFIRAQLGRGRGSDGSALDALVKNDILVVDGSFDRIGRVLHALRLPYTLVTPIAISLEKAPPLSQHKVVFWNCGESLSPARRGMASRRVREFVRRGGYLFTTDWAIANILVHAFPEYLTTSGPLAPLPEMIVDIEPARGQSRHPLLRGVFLPGVQGKWWLEQASFDVKVKRKRDVTVLIVSQELKDTFKRETGVAVLFSYGKGKVLHVMGHYFQEEGNMAGTIAAQRLALNFVLARLQTGVATQR